MFQRWLSEPELCGDLVYKLLKIVSNPDFSEQFNRFINRYKRIGYRDVMRKTALLVVNPIKVKNFSASIDCTTVGRAADSMKAQS